MARTICQSLPTSVYSCIAVRVDPSLSSSVLTTVLAMDLQWSNRFQGLLNPQKSFIAIVLATGKKMSYIWKCLVSKSATNKVGSELESCS